MTIFVMLQYPRQSVYLKRSFAARDYGSERDDAAFDNIAHWGESRDGVRMEIKRGA